MLFLYAAVDVTSSVTSGQSVLDRALALPACRSDRTADRRDTFHSYAHHVVARLCSDPHGLIGRRHSIREQREHPINDTSPVRRHLVQSLIVGTDLSPEKSELLNSSSECRFGPALGIALAFLSHGVCHAITANDDACQLLSFQAKSFGFRQGPPRPERDDHGPATAAHDLRFGCYGLKLNSGNRGTLLWE